MPTPLLPPFLANKSLSIHPSTHFQYFPSTPSRVSQPQDRISRTNASHTLYRHSGRKRKRKRTKGKKKPQEVSTRLHAIGSFVYVRFVSIITRVEQAMYVYINQEKRTGRAARKETVTGNTKPRKKEREKFSLTPFIQVLSLGI